jgi:hypothetical protein
MVRAQIRYSSLLAAILVKNISIKQRVIGYFCTKDMRLAGEHGFISPGFMAKSPGKQEVRDGQDERGGASRPRE